LLRIDNLKSSLTGELDQALKHNVWDAVIRDFLNNQPHHRIETFYRIHQMEAARLLDLVGNENDGLFAHLNNLTDRQVLTDRGMERIHSRKVAQRQNNGERKMVHTYLSSLLPGDKARFLTKTEGLAPPAVLELVHEAAPADERQVKTWREHDLVERFNRINNDRDLPLTLFPHSKERRQMSISIRSIFKEEGAQALLAWQRRTDSDFPTAIVQAVNERQSRVVQKPAAPPRNEGWRR
jgi:hypothetical protein